ncbi:MAG: hypothetical protein J5818_02390 [Eggerthellaceae bacterium]|nr:hypothetical protein [Eggerthellaceae bacterium]
MARKKSAEELMLEAELQAAEGNVRPAPRAASVHEDVSLPDVEKAATSRKPRLRERIKPKVVAIILGTIVVVLVIAFAVSRVMFANSTDVWDGTADTTWYSEGMKSMNITTAEQLAGMRKLCNDGVTLEGISFRLARNLDLYDIPTKPIGDGFNDQGKVREFCGSFDGCGHTISGINIEEDMWDHAGLFGCVSDGDIKNLTVEGRVVGQVRVGGVVGEMSGGSLVNLTNRCKVSSIKTATSYYPVSADVGGVCGIWLGIGHDGVSKADLSNLVNEGEVSARACSAGGVIGTLANSNGFTVSVSDLRNEGSVTVYCESDDRDEAVGGVIGVIGALGTDLVSKLENNGEVSCSTVLSVGGVIGALMAPQREKSQGSAGGHTEGIELKGLKNTARVAANANDERAHVGGIVGYLDDAEVVFDNCTNEGELAATNGNASELYATNGEEVWDEWEDTHPRQW